MHRFSARFAAIALGAALIALNACGGGGNGGGGTSDTAPPTVTAVDPPANAVGVGQTDPITATFSESIDPASVTSSSFVVRDNNGTAVAGTLSASGRTARFTPTTPLTKSALHQATVTTAIEDSAGNGLAADFVWSFTTTTDAWQATAIDAATPPARSDHTAVWSGSEMIVWGGDTAAGFTQTGGRYTPTLNAWTATANTGAPSARTDHTAIWSGSQMIVWGGQITGAMLTNTGGRYTPAPGAGAWTDTVIANTPASRRLHTAIWTGSEMIVWGGTSDVGLTSTGGRYSPTTNTWTAATSIGGAPAPRSDHTAVWTGSEMIVWGGTSDLGLTNTGARYRPATNDWLSIPTLGAPTARTGHTAVWTGSEMIVWGGTDLFGASNTGARFNPTSNTWSTISIVNAPTIRTEPTAVWTGTEMLVWGGDPSTNAGGRYRPSTDAWRSTGTVAAPTARTDHTAVWTGTQMIIWGGNDGTFTATGGRYIP